ncbi:MAG: hypothetical protein M3548_12230 [Actinomycetota bacterium]|nr:hypothetical protein [Actinomycetota bacterium]
MTEDEKRALGHVAAGALLFHNGLWGGPMGFLWSDERGSAAGRVPEWESTALTLLERRGLVSIRACLGTRDLPVVVTDAGVRVLRTR